MSEIKRRRSKPEKFIVWVISVTVAALIGGVVTWYVTKSLDDGSKTKVYDYAYNATSSDRSDGKASCWVNGIGGRNDAYKCAQESKIYSPCFRSDISEKVKCPNNPYNNDGVKYFDASFDDTKPLNASYGKEVSPWYVVLSGGDECRYVYGATNVIANKRMDFNCKSGLSLYLPIRDSGGVSVISCMKNSRLEDCKIEEMWR